MLADELHDVAVEGLGLLPVDLVSGLGQHDELGAGDRASCRRLTLPRSIPCIALRLRATRLTVLFPVGSCVFATRERKS